MIDRTRHDLLRRHVGGRADHDPGAGHRGAVGVRGQRARDAEVREEDVAIGDEHVVRLHVAVDDPLRMGVRQRVGQLAEDAHGRPDRQALVASQPAAQRFAVDERHDVEQRAVGRTGVEEREDVRMFEMRGGLDLVEKPLGPDRRGDIPFEHLDRDVALVFEVACEVDRRHAAAAKLSLEPIPRREGEGQSRRYR